MTLLQSAVSIPPAFVLSLTAIILGRRGRRQANRTLGRPWPVGRRRRPRPRIRRALPGRDRHDLRGHLLRTAGIRSLRQVRLQSGGRRVRDRKQPARGAPASGPRVRRGGAGDQDSRQVPARPRGRAVRRSSRAKTYVKGFLRNMRSTWASTGSSTSTSTTRGTSPATRRRRFGRRTSRRSGGTASGVERRPGCARSHRDRHGTVVVAWRFGSDTPETAIPDFSSQPETRASSSRSPRARGSDRTPTITGCARRLLGGGASSAPPPAGSCIGARQGRSTIRFAQRRMHVVMGRPGNLRLKVNGRVVEVPRTRQHDGGRDHCTACDSGSLSRLSTDSGRPRHGERARPRRPARTRTARSSRES